jgi:hypothetical protein
MAEERKKVEIGFGLGQVLSVKLTQAELTDLRRAVESREGWYDLEPQEGPIALNLSMVVFIRVVDPAHTIGFTG